MLSVLSPLNLASQSCDPKSRQDCIKKNQGKLTRRFFGLLFYVFLISSGGFAQRFVACSQEDDSGKGEQEGCETANVPPAEDDAEVFGVPVEEHLRLCQRPCCTRGQLDRRLTFMVHMPGMTALSMLPWSMWEWSISRSPAVRIGGDRLRLQRRGDNVKVKREQALLYLCISGSRETFSNVLERTVSNSRALGYGSRMRRELTPNVLAHPC